MKKRQYLKLLIPIVAEYRQRPYKFWREQVGGEPITMEVPAGDGQVCQVEIDAMWDHKPNANIRVFVMIDDGGKWGGWINRDFSSKFKFFPEGYVGNKKLGLMAYGLLTHTVSPNTFYEIRVSQLNRSGELGYSDDNGNGIVETGENGDFIVIDDAAESEKYLGVQGSSVDASGNSTFFTADPGNERTRNIDYAQNQYRLGQPGFFYDKTDRNVLQLKADITSQINFNNQLKAGFLYRYHTVSQFQQRTQVRVIFDNQFRYISMLCRKHSTN